MPVQPQEKHLMTSAEYLEMERAALDIRHEFFNGEVFAMIGAGRNHNRINVNLTKKLGINFETSPARCEVFSNDMRVNPTTILIDMHQVPEASFFYVIDRHDDYGFGSKRSVQAGSQRFGASSAKRHQ